MQRYTASGENADTLRRQRQRNLIFLILVLIGFTIYYVFNSSDTVALAVNDASLTVTGPDSYTFDLPFSEITSLELLSDVDYGSPSDGAETGSCAYGLWSNGTWGEYTLCVRTDCSAAIALNTESGAVFVINFESDSATESFYSAFTKLLVSKGYLS
ncbi:MAG: hypothetical protein ACI3VN_05520 [Candidatus Onthomonas sp.]